jgi:hypothetical protein
MTAVTNFVRKTPAASLQTYFKRTGIQLMPAVDWDAPEADVVRLLLQAVEGLDDSAAARVVNDAERVTAMADEAGQAAIFRLPKAEIAEQVGKMLQLVRLEGLARAVLARARR